MNHRLTITLLFTFLLTSLSSWAIKSPGDNNWECTAHDNEERQWVANSAYQLTATNKAFEECKKESHNPTSCKVVKESCEGFVHGVSTRPMWRCTALDQMAKAWMSNIYAHRDDAAIAARSYCQERSAMPDSCYINLMTCKNLNNS